MLLNVGLALIFTGGAEGLTVETGTTGGTSGAGGPYSFVAD
ncbi:MAG TPA: hypothetical protein VHV32_19400 [Candidatus Angelobacter sp.]|nr:hypothetical protein [Candidatus Angelobacter sp.]